MTYELAVASMVEQRGSTPAFVLRMGQMVHCISTSKVYGNDLNGTVKRSRNSATMLTHVGIAGARRASTYCSTYQSHGGYAVEKHLLQKVVERNRCEINLSPDESRIPWNHLLVQAEGWGESRGSCA